MKAIDMNRKLEGVFRSRPLTAAGWPGQESLWTKPRGFAKRSNPGHPTASGTRRDSVKWVRVVFQQFGKA